MNNCDEFDMLNDLVFFPEIRSQKDDSYKRFKIKIWTEFLHKKF